VKKVIIFLLIVIISFCFICGCVNQSLPSISKSDDDVYIENLENFFIQDHEILDRYFASIDYNVSIKNREEDLVVSHNKLVADRIKLSETNYNKFAILKVSYKLDHSKHSFLLYLTEIGLPHHIQEKRKPFCWDPLNCYEQLFLDKTFDSELCSKLKEKKSNLVHHCYRLNDIDLGPKY